MFNRNILVLILGLLTFSSQAQIMQGFSEQTLRSDGAERSYTLYVPENASPEGAPLVFSFHGSGGVPQHQVNISGFNQLSDQYGFISVFPAGAFTNSVTARSWNANNVSMPDPNAPLTTIYPLEDVDYRLRRGSVAIDKGQVLPNVNDDFSGQAPDLGAIEFGDAIPHFGPRPRQ